MHDRTIRILSKHLKSLNIHLPEERKTLKYLLSEEKPRIKLRDGSTHIFKKAELKKLAEILPEGMHSRLRLPIYIELGSGRYGKGTARIIGEPEVLVVAKVLGKEIAKKDEIYVYKPELRVLRRELPTTTQYIFTFDVV